MFMFLNLLYESISCVTIYNFPVTLHTTKSTMFVNVDKSQESEMEKYIIYKIIFAFKVLTMYSNARMCRKKKKNFNDAENVNIQLFLFCFYFTFLLFFSADY